MSQYLTCGSGFVCVTISCRLSFFVSWPLSPRVIPEVATLCLNDTACREQLCFQARFHHHRLPELCGVPRRSSSIFLFEVFMTQLALRTVFHDQFPSYLACTFFPRAIFVLSHLEQQERILVVTVLI